ncbi:MAG: hypothetical protein ACKV2V_13735 [Blastocatellia bacterium]
MSRRIATILFLAFCFSFLYLRAFLWPHTPYWLAGDGVIFLNNAWRMLHGEALYRDFLQITTPGTDLLFLLTLQLFGPAAWAQNVLVLCLGMALLMTQILITRRLVTGALAFLPSLLFLVFQFRLDVNGGHHWVSMLLALIVIYTLLPRENSAPGLALTGFLCGLTALVTQHRGAVVLLGVNVFLFYEQWPLSGRWITLWRRLIRLNLVCLATFAAGMSWYVWRAGAARLWQDLMVFPMTSYRGDFWVNRPGVYLHTLSLVWREGYSLTLMAAFTYTLIPLIYFVSLYVWRRRAAGLPATQQRGVALLIIMGLALLAGAVYAPSCVRLAHVSQPGLILLAWTFDQMLPRLGRAARPLIVMALLLPAIALTRAAWLQQTGNRRTVLTPAGLTAIYQPQLYDDMAWLAAHTQPGEYFLSSTVSFYYPLRLRNPTALPFLVNGQYTTVAQTQALIERLEQTRPRLIHWRPFPARAELTSVDNLEPLRQYLNDKYRVVTSFPAPDVLWERKP